MPQNKPVSRDEKGRLQKGSTANPGGRPKMPDWVRDRFDKMMPQALKNLEDGLLSDDETLKRWATGEVLDRGLGRPAQAVQVHTTTEVDDMDRQQVQEWLSARGIPATVVN